MSRTRWRLILGDDPRLGPLEGQEAAMDAALGFLYDREPSANRRGGLGDSTLSVPRWIDEVQRLFPKQTLERIERDALERYRMHELVTDPRVLERIVPSQALLSAVLRTKHLMDGEVLAAARVLVRKVVDQLLATLTRPVRTPFGGAVDPRRRSALRIANNLDMKTTLRRNLKGWDPGRRRLVLQRPFFWSRVRRSAERWQVIVLVDQSGSMVSSVIHAAVTAAIFHGLGHLRTTLAAFDTSVVDLSRDLHDPVETLMRVQLGGGTDIGGALIWAADQVREPRRTMLVLITDFAEGAGEDRLLRAARALVSAGVTCLGLGALDRDANPAYDRTMAENMVLAGFEVGVMTPGELAGWVAEKVRG